MANTQKLNDYVYNNGLAKIMNAYFLLTNQQNGPDTAETIVLNVIEGAFWAIGSEGGPIGNFAASFLSGTVSYWATNTPPSLNAQFANFTSRFQATSLQVDTQLANYAHDVAGNWNTTFSYNGNTVALSDLASADFPKEIDPAFEKMAKTALFALDQGMWTQLLQESFVVTHWLDDGAAAPKSIVPDPVAWAQGYYTQHPAYYETWTWHTSTGCGDTDGWVFQDYNLGTGASVLNDASLNAPACAYLFQDSTPGVTINPDGLFTRVQVFTGLNLRQVDLRPPPIRAAEAELSTGYLRAMKEGKTLGGLVASEGRAALEKRVIDRAQSDPISPTIFCEAPAPDTGAVFGRQDPRDGIVERRGGNSRNFGLVIPARKT